MTAIIVFVVVAFTACEVAHWVHREPLAAGFFLLGAWVIFAAGTYTLFAAIRGLL